MNAWYKIARFLGKIILFFGPPVLVFGSLPENPAVIFSNHYSFLDPPLLAIMLNRRLWFLALPEVLEWKFIGWLIRKSRSAISISSTGPFGLKGAIKILKSGGTIVIFPEGTRSETREVQDFKPGLAMLTKFAKAVPIAIDGTFEAWPRGRRLPRRYKIKILIGKPIEFSPEQENEEIVRIAKKEISLLLRQG
ncbi:MAG: hypothetical protein A2Y98_00740 [Candidatus Portnoybacteria bacterium RBG_19FT_COMBO_36_7]|uniref:Phospholipid/glycerol acyltransferase domain-containing protein n=1 Tax=Candidatus Portnoybacteria bacterium RBG_19FT_COMBO_36_7 TaxID=1801992 RepID=A0A1G2F8N2_9BACT|nr:MAG: hypothetical protein A2Y98_00740 [Candidatus Portnoybacteria bacterium RBG_19FT_COMBO_36_7]